MAISDDDFEVYVYKWDNGDGFEYLSLLEGDPRLHAQGKHAAETQQNFLAAIEAEAEKRGIEIPWG